MMQKIKVWDIDTFYEEWGHPDSPTIVFLHGYPGRPKDFRWLISELKEYRLLILALPGLGNTELPKQDLFSVSSRAEFVRSFLKQLHISSCSLLAHSMGGMIGTHLAHTYPLLIHKLILISSVGPIPYRAFRRSKPHWAHVIFNRTPFRFFGGPILHYLFTLFGFPKGVSTDSMSYVLACAARISFSEHKHHLESIEQPVLSIWCRDDPLIEPESFEKLYTSLRDGKQVSFDVGGHNPQKKHATDVARIVREFLED